MNAKDHNLKKEKAKIIQFSDDTRTLPDGSKIIYAENEEKIVIYHKPPFERGVNYVYDRESGSITLNGKPGTNQDKRMMVKLGSYLLNNSKDYDLVTIRVLEKGKSKK